MITLSRTTSGNIILDGPYCPEAVAKNANMKPKEDGNERIILEEKDMDDFLIRFIELRARIKRGGA